uniref:Uncharacterized protein n=1 Tax=Corethron hystrix TaxID=216773 RepID=A0A7S1FMG9_9STRA
MASSGGGCPQLLLARERGAPPQPRLARGRPVEFTTLGELGWDESGELYTLPCPVALFFDVYCRDRSGWTHKWSGVHPLKSTYTTFTIPFSANSLGDKTTNATFYHHEAFECLPRYFFSADHDDERQWRFNVSAVTSRSAETLLLSSEMVPSKVVQAIEKKNLWEKDGGYGEFLREKKNFEGVIRSGKYNSMYSKSISRGRHRFNSKFQDKNLWRAYEERPDDPYGDRSIPSVTVKGIDWEGNVRDIDYPHYEMNYWLEKRVDGNDQLHMTLAFECEHMFWSDVMLRCSSERGVIGERLIKRSRLN